jgi:anthranilate synthase/aminodeoxychorismate synthase-like glutamine amidotransferase
VLLLIDNYDSFVFNLARYLEELGETVTVIRNDAISVRELDRLAPTTIVISPGPGTPRDAGICLELVRSVGARTPILGVCLGHQCIAEAYGGRVVRARRPMHGLVCGVKHAGVGLFAWLSNPLAVTRYHSLVVDPTEPGTGLEIAARTEDTSDDEAEVMAIQHATHPVWGVQFHPEALRTEGGHRLLANFLALARGQAAPGATDCPAEGTPELDVRATTSTPGYASS